MPKGDLERNTFVRGLITEATPLTFPENASKDEDNFVLNRDGSRQRRKGMDYEAGYSLISSALDLDDFEDTVVTSYRWENVSNDGSISFLVVQIGRLIRFFDSFENILSNNEIDSISINSVAAQYPIQYADVDGKLIVTNQAFTKPSLISYDGSSFTTTSVNLEVRDIWGVEDNLDINERPTTLSNRHRYNLQNQGWPNENYKGSDGSFRKPYDLFNFQNSDYPSNADIWHYGLKSDGGDSFEWVIQGVGLKWFGSTPAPKGHYVIDLFNRSASRSSQSGISQVTDTTSAGISTIASFAGRVFYSGIVVTDDSNEHSTAPLLSSSVVFTQVIDNDDKLGKCYSINDPTSSDLNAPLPTDGGVITITGASRILKLINKDSSLLVIAENGVWEIFGADGVFRSDDYAIRQISNIGATNAQSIINAEGDIYYWSKAGIYVLTNSETDGTVTAINLSETTIQSFYVSIPSVGRTNAVARYDSDARKVSWLYNDESGYDGITQKNKYNREITLDLTLNAFYTYTFGENTTDAPYVAGYAPTSGFNTTNYSQNVTHNGDQVQVNGDNVVVTQTVRSRGSSSTKYVAVKPNSSGNVTFTFSLFNNLEFLDWEADDSTGTDASAFMEAGYELFGDTMRKKQIPYLFMHFKRTEENFIVSGTDLEADNPSSCLIQTRWDFADSSAGGKYGTQFQAYRLKRNLVPAVAGPFDYGQDVITTKNKLRGIGRAFSMRLDTEPGKDCYIYGWGIHVEAGRNV